MRTSVGHRSGTVPHGAFPGVSEVGRRLRPALALAAALVLFLGSCSSGATPSSRSKESAKPKVSYTTLIATVTNGVDNIPVYSKPGGDQTAQLSNPTPVGARRVVLVRKIVRNGWLHVLLPTRPNGSTGWIRPDNVVLSKTTYRMHVYLSEHRYVVKHDKDDVFARGKIAVGKERTPTPDGDYYLISLLNPPKEGSIYGAYAFGLSGFSSVLDSFSGGPGRIGLHGTSKPELLGKDVSHGCIRLSNADITKLATNLPLGTPVYVHA